MTKSVFTSASDEKQPTSFNLTFNWRHLALTESREVAFLYYARSNLGLICMCMMHAMLEPPPTTCTSDQESGGDCNYPLEGIT